MLPLPKEMTEHPALRPLVRLCQSVLLTTEEVAKHWRYAPQSVHNMRRLKSGPAYVKIGGAVRYRLSEIMHHELHGHRGPITLDRVSLALSTMPGPKREMREQIEAHLQKTFGVQLFFGAPN